ncbi:CoA-acylating methylmalonate-semialdehyde dehydrogenase [Desulfofustis limnaeus]|jgi:malonate-semialdehyde dehydrogenase (acetylating)/methylmalonate-semialdehyde dehydrogenase|uniref:Methylmalonate-semialdehyde dehydrogenase (Acylating) n=1 Tax=Desulfofustis limnaeus TaxID=2740163 RepID=A0ABM7WAK9_9BACT|nr:CoA-acylating methylmalonate-semialdehyde dehydrogenase [Desulfofustis limnaeus]MDX9895238.1 CoA-acylating methylmalonate-semialdehyde dehydrogenase [Desulfofustis sp.]BDD87935.1 methylmalonate-semialdehyde dehydrogenase (acylating) [Desulfofustis limnaeus]
MADQTNRYFVETSTDAGSPAIKKLKYHAGGRWLESTSDRYMDCFNPSTGEVIARAPQCTADEVEKVIAAAVAAYPSWSDTPVSKRVQVLYRMKHLVDAHLEELTYLLAMEMGKAWQEAMGDILKVNEVVEFACGAPHLMKGESLMQVSTGYDTVQYHHPLGVFAGIAPWNFPAMIPHGWMTPICVATGNCMVLKAASFVPQSSLRLMELWQEAGIPDGVINVFTAGRNEAEILLRHPDIKGVSFVGSTKVGKHIYTTAAANGKRVQALTEAKNHALVLRDCKLERTAHGIINAFCGCAGQRCMALPVVVVENVIGDQLVAMLKKLAADLKLGKAYDKSTNMGPVVNQGHQKFVLDWIETGIQEGAELVVDGRHPELSGDCAKGFFIGPTIFDKVTEEMAIGREEIFGPVLCIKRVDSFAEGLQIMNQSRFANGSVIYTQNGHYAREFAKRTDAGMVGVNVGIPVPLGIFGFTGHKQSFFGDLHVMGRDGFAFFTETKNVTQTWFSESEAISAKVDTWDGTITSLPENK